MNFKKIARHKFEQNGWEIEESVERREIGWTHREDCPVWKLHSIWPPTTCMVALWVQKDGLVGGGRRDLVKLELKFDDQFETELDGFVAKLQMARVNHDPYDAQVLTILGVRPGMTRDEVELFLGEPEMESKVYKRVQSHRVRRAFDVEGVACVYGKLQVSYYHDGEELKVFQVWGPQLERDGVIHMKVGDEYDPRHRDFEWDLRDVHEGWLWKLHNDWKDVAYEKGSVLIGEDEKFKEFALSDDSWLHRGKRVD